MDNWDVLLKPWTEEPVPGPERRFTPWADSWWQAWNEHAVEVAVAEYLGELSKVMSDRKNFVVVETGCGQGFVTRRLHVGDGELWAYESDDLWRARIRQFFTPPQRQLKGPSPTVHEISQADLVILDSMDPYRMGELCLWAASGKPGSVMVLHDTGTYHPTWDGHFTLGMLARTLRIGGYWLGNPRGGLVAQKGVGHPDMRYITPWTRLLEQLRHGR